MYRVDRGDHSIAHETKLLSPDEECYLGMFNSSSDWAEDGMYTTCLLYTLGLAHEVLSKSTAGFCNEFLILWVTNAVL